jgi:hypothetical protein
VSLDINTLYLELSKDVSAYFKVCISIKPSEIMLCEYLTIQKRNQAVHLAIDGWTSPLRSSYLGVIVIWYDCGKIHRAILEFLRFVFILFCCRKLLRIFLRLTESHDGKYLASRLADCLKWFGLKEFVSYHERYKCNSCLIMTTDADAMYGQCRKLQYNGKGAPGHHP